MKKYTLKNMWHSYGKGLIVVIIFALLGALALGGRAMKKKSTTYTASRQIVISHNITNNLSSNNNNSNTSIVAEDSNMMPTYKDIAENAVIANKARTYLSHSMRKKYSADDIKSSISAKVSQQSLVMDLKSKTKSSKDSVKIVNAVSRAMKNELPRLQPGSGRVTLLQKATNDDVSSETTPSVKKHAVVGFALGALLGLIIDFIVITIKNFGHKE